MRFADYRANGHLWITLASTEYYPDVLTRARELYGPVIAEFRHLATSAYSSEELLMTISRTADTRRRIQLCRAFRKYVSPSTPVEMLKQKSKARQICDQFGALFRPIEEVKAAVLSRAVDDEALAAIFWEYKDRGQSGYNLTETAFETLREILPGCTIEGPERAGRDVIMGMMFEGYPKPDRPIDFLIRDPQGVVVAVGLAHYDSDRGGGQEDDRTGQYREVAAELIAYFDSLSQDRVKVIFVNDGPGLLLGSMWRDYAYIEAMNPARIMVATLKMLSHRVTREWLES